MKLQSSERVTYNNLIISWQNCIFIECKRDFFFWWTFYSSLFFFQATVEIESTQQEEKKEVVEFKEEAEEIEKSVQQDEAKENVEEESQAQIVKNVLEKLGLASDEIKPEDKIDTLCVIFKQTLTENVK